MPTMEEVRDALGAGATRQELLLAGYPGSSITKAQQQLKKAGAGDGRRQTGPRRPKGSTSNQLIPVRTVTPVLPAPSSELADKREQLQLAKLANELTVEQQKTARLQPDAPESNEIANARGVLGLMADAKALFPAPELSAQTPAAGGSKLSSEQESNLAIARMELEERQLIRGEERELQQVEQKAELIQEIGGHITRGLSGFLKVLSEIPVSSASTPTSTTTARRRQPLELNPSPSPGGWSADGQTWTTSKPVAMVAENPVSEIALQPADRPGGTWIASADAETGEVISWAWAPDPPAETVRERLQRVGQKAAGQNSGASRVV